jgi:PPOX class probable F420-dependent enzyme
MGGLDPDVERFLRDESIVWLSTARPDGRPHLVPIWFSWDGRSFLIFSKPEAQKVRNLRSNPEVMLALGEPDDDFDVQLVEGRAEALEASTAEVMPLSHVRKYASRMRSIGLTVDEYVRTYSQPIRVIPTRFLAWRGRAATAARRGSARPESARRGAARPRLALAG